MKLLMICTVPLEGNGIATCAINYACGLGELGQDVHILAPEGVNAALRRELDTKGVCLHELPDRKKGVLQYVTALYAHLQQQRYDVVHVHGNSCTVAIELLSAALAGVPVRIAHSHNTACQHKKAHMLLRPVFELCVNGRFACGKEAGYWLFGKRPFTVIRNGIDLSRYQPSAQIGQQLRNTLAIPESTLLLGHVGMFVEAKNHAFLLKLAQALKKNLQQDWRLLLVGQGPLQDQIQKEAEMSGLSDRLIFTGNVPDTSPYLQAMDLFLLPSLYEGLPFVLVETQAAGLLSLVSDQVSTEADMTGNLHFLPIDSVNPWLQAIEDFSPTDRDATGKEACRRLDAAGYNMQSNVRHLYNSYEELLRRKNKTVR